MIYSLNNIQKIKAKVTVLLSLFCFLNTSNLEAQEARFGAKAGLNYSSVVGNLTEGIKFRFSGHAGIYLDVYFSEKFSFQPEFLYSSQGFQFSSDLAQIDGNPTPGGNDFRTNVQLNFITIPVLGKFRLGENYSLEFGPQVGFLLNQVTKIKNLDEINATNEKSRNSISGKFQLDYGAAVGLSFKVSEQLSISPRMYLGLRNRLNGAEGNIQNYNASIQLSVNYLFL